MFGMTMQPQLLLQMECAVCKRHIDSEAKDESVTNAALFGHAQYAICPGCLTEVPRSDWTPQYKRNWTRRVNKMKRESEANAE